MKNDSVDQLVRAVTRVVGQRLESKDPALIELVVQEVTQVLGASPNLPANSHGAEETAHATAGVGARDNGDGTMTTGLGSVVAKSDSTLLATCLNCVEQKDRTRTSRAVLTSSGQNRRGVVAQISTAIADAGGNIEDMSQQIVGDFFTMIMVVDIENLELPFAAFKERLLEASGTLGIHTVVMHEDIVRALQRV
jgi:ACT domain-containing protein